MFAQMGPDDSYWNSNCFVDYINIKKETLINLFKSQKL